MTGFLSRFAFLVMMYVLVISAWTLVRAVGLGAVWLFGWLHLMCPWLGVAVLLLDVHALPTVATVVVECVGAAVVGVV